jgi:hypothetical protein
VSRPSEKCSIERHEAIKRDEQAWQALKPRGFQEDYTDDNRRADLELRDCPCGSTIARRAP